MRFGVHCSVRQGFVAALEEAREIGGQTLQIFSRPPRRWRTHLLAEDEAAAFRRRRRELGLWPLVVHTPYLPNLCTSHARFYGRSLRALADDLERCERLEADFLVIHCGAYAPGDSPEQGLRRMAEALNGALAAAGRTRVLIENVAGGGRRLGSTWEELARLLEGIRRRDRVGFCLDTAHTLAAGHAFGTAEEVRQTLEAFERRIGLRQIGVIHANDSQAARGSHRDLHAHIGQGYIGEAGFRALVRHESLQHCAVILETPRDDRRADDGRNLSALRRLAAD